MNIKELVDSVKNTYESFTWIPKIQMLWHSGYWDGPTSGVCEVDNQKCWFAVVKEFDDFPPEYFEDGSFCFDAPWFRRFIIVKLTDEQWNVISQDHQYVIDSIGGFFISYDKDNRRVLWGANPNSKATEESRKLYWDSIGNGTRKYPDIQYSVDQIIGWYER